MLISAPISKLLMAILAYALPSYKTFKAVRTSNNKLLKEWCIYWLLIGLFVCFEWIADLALFWFPLYYEFKIAFVMFLWHPRTRGSLMIYERYVEPVLASKEEPIDRFLLDAGSKVYYIAQTQISRIQLTALQYVNYVLEQLKSYSLPQPTAERQRQ